MFCFCHKFPRIAATHPPSDSFLSDFFLLRNFATDVSAAGMDGVFIIELEMYAKSILTDIRTRLTSFQNLLLDKIKQYIPHALFVKQDS